MSIKLDKEYIFKTPELIIPTSAIASKWDPSLKFMEIKLFINDIQQGSEYPARFPILDLRLEDFKKEASFKDILKGNEEHAAWRGDKVQSNDEYSRDYCNNFLDSYPKHRMPKNESQIPSSCSAFFPGNQTDINRCINTFRGCLKYY